MFYTKRVCTIRWSPLLHATYQGKRHTWRLFGWWRCERRVQWTVIFLFWVSPGESKSKLYIIQNEAGDEWAFQGDNMRNDFWGWLFSENCIVMAHNCKCHDSYFILQYLRGNAVKYDVIMCVAKVFYLIRDNVQNHSYWFPELYAHKVSKFPQTLGLITLAEGYFPHLFSKKENEQYIGPLPPSSYGVSYERKRISSLNSFRNWGKIITCLTFNNRSWIIAVTLWIFTVAVARTISWRHRYWSLWKMFNMISAGNNWYNEPTSFKITIVIIPPHVLSREQAVHPSSKIVSFHGGKEQDINSECPQWWRRRLVPYLLDGGHEEPMLLTRSMDVFGAVSASFFKGCCCVCILTLHWFRIGCFNSVRFKQDWL